MRLFIFLATLLTSGVSTVLAQNAKSNLSDEQKVLQLDYEYKQAIMVGDAQSLNRILSDEFISMSHDGRSMRKQALLTSAATAKRYEMKRDTSDFTVKILGNTAILTGREVLSFKPGTETVYLGDFYTNVYIKKDNKWQLVHNHSTTLPDWRFREVSDAELKPLPKIDCSQLASMKALYSKTPTYVRFHNVTSSPIIVSWINHNGEPDTRETQRVTVQPGKSLPRNTFVTHPYIVTSTQGGCLGIYQPSSEPSLVVVR